MAAVEVRGLAKDYASVRAVDDLSFHVSDGEIYGLLGHNGAGKTTTVEILEGHRDRTAGQVSVLGFDPARRSRELRDRVGVVLQTSGIEREFTVREAVDIYGSAYRLRRSTDEVIDMVGLSGKADERIGSLSGGQRRRVDLALGVVGTPELLFLDEPTTGFDPAARRIAWELIESLADDGVTVVLTTHYLEEAERLADRVGIIVNGKLAAEGPPRELATGLGTTRIAFDLPGEARASELDGVLPDGAQVAGSHVEFVTGRPTFDVHRVTSWAVERGFELSGLAVARSSLEDVFLGLGDEATTTSDDHRPVRDDHHTRTGTDAASHEGDGR